MIKLLLHLLFTGWPEQSPSRRWESFWQPICTVESWRACRQMADYFCTCIAKPTQPSMTVCWCFAVLSQADLCASWPVQIRTIERVCEIPHEGPFCDLMWSDPEETETWAISPRGAGWLFGARVAAEFNQINGLELICRAHQLVQEGLKYMFPPVSKALHRHSSVWSAQPATSNHARCMPRICNLLHCRCDSVRMRPYLLQRWARLHCTCLLAQAMLCLIVLFLTGCSLCSYAFMWWCTVLHPWCSEQAFLQGADLRRTHLMSVGWANVSIDYD